MALSLGETILLAQSQALTVDRLMGELARAHALGNVDRIGNAAHDASMAAMELDTRLGAVFSMAADIACQESERAYASKYGRAA